MKWHPKQQDTLAVASGSDIYVLNIADASRAFHGEPIVQSELHRLVQSMRMLVVSHDFPSSCIPWL